MLTDEDRQRNLSAIREPVLPASPFDAPRKPRSTIGAVLVFGGYWWTTLVVALFATYAFYWVTWLATFAQQRIGTTGPLPFDQINALAWSNLDATVSTGTFTLFVSVCAVGAVLCRRAA